MARAQARRYRPDAPGRTRRAAGPRVVGHVEPRIWTPPLRKLDRRTSYGYDAAEFAAEVLGRPPDPWQRWLMIHAGELLPDGRPRFRTVLVLVARQNGKTEVPVMLSSYWMFVQQVPLILGTSSKLDYAKESWRKHVRLAGACEDPQVAGQRHRRWTRATNGEQESWTGPADAPISRYKIAAANADGGRSLTIHRLVLDEIRQHQTYEAWDAAVPACNAVPDAQIWCLSNAGSDASIVLNDLRASALEFIQTGRGDDRLGLFEWSAPEGSDPEDVEALRWANPNLGHRIDVSALLSQARRAVARGGASLAGFKIENMCMTVPTLDPAIEPVAWARSSDPGDLSAVRGKVSLCLDVAPDGQHVTLAAAGVLPDDRIRIEVVEAWVGLGATDRARRALPALVTRIKPRQFGWLPNGPAAELAADLADRRKAGKMGWPPPGVTVVEIRSDVPAVCMGLAGLVAGGRIAHSDDPLLNAHVGAAEKLAQGDVWVFSRRGKGHVDAAYAAAGAAHLARTLPTPIGRPRLIRAKPQG